MLITWIKSWTPIGLDIPFDTVMNVAESIDSPDKGWQTAPAQFPIINQWSDALQNVEDKTGLVPNPMAQFNKQFIQQELPE
jgi:hypothetical protein